MTHFVAVVIGPDVEKQLDPYDENTQVTPYRRYMDEESLARAKDYYRTRRPEDIDPNDPEVDPERPETWMELWSGYPGGFDEKGAYHMSRYNPESKWDWWEVGGRWSGFFVLRDQPLYGYTAASNHRTGSKPVLADAAAKVDVDWEAIAAKERQYARDTWRRMLAEDRPLDTKAFIYGIPREIIDLPEDEREEAYVERLTLGAGVPRAVVHEGKWMERGSAAWFGQFNDVVTADEWSKLYWDLIQSLPPDTRLTAVDCHI